MSGLRDSQRETHPSPSLVKVKLIEMFPDFGLCWDSPENPFRMDSAWSREALIWNRLVVRSKNLDPFPIFCSNPPVPVDG
jgi:hypothetical protein